MDGEKCLNCIFVFLEQLLSLHIKILKKTKSWKTQYQNCHYYSKCVLLEFIFRSNVLLISKPSSQAALTQTSSALLLSSDSVLNCTSCTRPKSCHLLTDCVPVRVYSMSLSAQWVRLLFLGCWAVWAAVVICLLSWLYVGLETSCRSNDGDVVGYGEIWESFIPIPILEF